MGRLAGQLAVITGADYRLARAFADALAREGAALALVGEQDATEPVKVTSHYGTDVRRYTVRGDQESVQSFVDNIVNGQGSPTILVTLASEPTFTPSMELREEAFRAVVDDSLMNAFRWSQWVGDVMRKRKQGVIVHVTGLCGLGGWPGWLAYGAAFASIHNLTQTLAVEWAKDGVRVNCLVPGVSDSLRRQIESTLPPEKSTRVIERIPAGRMATDQDVVQGLLYLVDPMATFVTGEILRIDGGWDSWGRLYAVARDT